MIIPEQRQSIMMWITESTQAERAEQRRRPTNSHPVSGLSYWK